MRARARSVYAARDLYIFRNARDTSRFHRLEVLHSIYITFIKERKEKRKNDISNHSRNDGQICVTSEGNCANEAVENRSHLANWPNSVNNYPDLYRSIYIGHKKFVTLTLSLSLSLRCRCRNVTLLL